MTSLRIMNLGLWPVNVTGIKRNIMTSGYHTQDQQSCKNYGVVAKSGANALNFDHVSQLGWEFIKRGICLKDTTSPKRSHLPPQQQNKTYCTFHVFQEHDL